MQHISAWDIRSSANRLFYSVSAIQCSYHSASHSCGSDEGCLQPSLWLPKLSSILQNLAKMEQSFRCIFTSKVCCAKRIFHSVSTIYCSFHSARHSCGSDEGSLQPSLWQPRLSSQFQKLAKCSTALLGP